MSASVAAVAPQSGSSRRARANAIFFSFDQHGPDDPRGLGGERHHGDLVWPSREQLAQPRVADAASFLLPQMGACPADEERAEHAVTLLGDPAGPMLAAGAVIAAGQPDPGREIAPRAEHLGIGHLGQNRAGDDRADARYLHQPAGLMIGAGGLGDLSFKRALVSIQ